MKIYDGNVLSFGMFSQFKFEDHRFDTQFLGDFNEFIYCQNFCGGSFGQVEAVDVGDVGKWRQKLI